LKKITVIWLSGTIIRGEVDFLEDVPVNQEVWETWLTQ